MRTKSTEDDSYQMDNVIAMYETVANHRKEIQPFSRIIFTTFINNIKSSMYMFVNLHNEKKKTKINQNKLNIGKRLSFIELLSILPENFQFDFCFLSRLNCDNGGIFA